MGRINTGSMGSDRAVHEHSENEPSPAWKQMEAADSSGYWVSKDTGANVKRITVSNPTQNVAGVLISNEPSLDAASTSRLFQNHFKEGNFLGIWDVTNGDANVVLDMHVVFVRLHDYEHPSPKTARTLGSVASPASEFVTLRPYDYQLSIQIICHSDGSLTTIILLDEVSDVSGPESTLHHVFDADLRSLTTADSSTTRLGKCIRILDLHVGQVASEWESVYSQFSQATAQLLYKNDVIIESPSVVLLAQKRAVEARRLTSMLIIKLDRIVEALRSSRLDSRLETLNFNVLGRPINESGSSPPYGTLEKLLRVLTELRSLETEIEEYSCAISLRHLSDSRRREEDDKVKDVVSNGVRRRKVQHLNFIVLQIFSPMALAGSLIQAGFGNALVSFVVLTVLLTTIALNLAWLVQKWDTFTDTGGNSETIANEFAPHNLQNGVTVRNKYLKCQLHAPPEQRRKLSNATQPSSLSCRLSFTSQLVISARELIAKRLHISLDTFVLTFTQRQAVPPGDVLVSWKCVRNRPLHYHVKT
ncbi:hypothetical protein K456DRAFT_387140 [Colletotrichum gloeosporioides 23]|nr:hypothetical protein K456DRAFT_387140 [Colletotrichum gloeosporioides 23]